ncbi:MAG: 1-deoxy-D-xylulose-5-phosphate synthase [Eubacteriales bacterium]|nr:1-deoxy-D-xylulose-5-phosphate synthase [Eubacteriales bacterium]
MQTHEKSASGYLQKELTDYHFPSDLKKMSEGELEILSLQIRDFLVSHVSETGGHLASNLGVVELTIALHKVFNSPKDKLIFDVGHQAYVHKILTGRADRFDTLRQTGGMSGFPKGKESPHDAYDTGHASTSLSAASGIAAARDLKKEHFQVVSVIGDGSLTGGMALEALNNIGSRRQNVIVILNDNGMSISRNTGSISQHLSKLRVSRKYLSSKQDLKRTLEKIPYVGNDIENILSNLKESVKYAILQSGILFEEMGFTYMGPVNGHSIPDLVQVLRDAKRARGPVLVHVITKKGKGYRIAEKNPDKFHGIGPFDPDTGEVLHPSGKSWSSVFGETLSDAAEIDSRIIAITAAMSDGTGLKKFSEKFPNRFFDVGIEEEHAVGFAAGLAKGGMQPVLAIYSSFLQRAFDQIMMDVCLQDLPVIFAVDRAGIVGADGETHHGIFDIAYLSMMPNLTILTPGTGEQLSQMLRYALTLSGPCAIRYPRGEAKVSEDTNILLRNAARQTPSSRKYTREQAELLKNRANYGNLRLAYGKDGDIWAVGSMLDTAVKTREILLDQGISVGLVDVRQVKPLDISMATPDIRRIYTLEDGVFQFGFGTALRTALPGKYSVVRFGWPDRFIEQGSPKDLYRKYGLDPFTLAGRIRRDIEERKA